MKKIISISLICIFIYCIQIYTSAAWNGSNTLKPYVQEDVEFRASWVSTVYNMDVEKQKDTSEESINEWKKQYLSILDNLQQCNINVIIFQIRPCNDAFYPSKYNPWSEYLCGYGKDPGWDPLEWMIEVTHERGMEYHAWMNPYRVTTNANISFVQNNGGTTESIYDYDNDIIQNDKHTVFSNKKTTAKLNGTINMDNPVFLEGEELEYSVVLGAEKKYVLNPASPKTIEHLTNTIKEVIDNYDIDGIHFDDYFYPDDKVYSTIGTNNNFKGMTFSTEPYVDYEDYQNYKTSGGKLDIYNWRRENVNILIKTLSDVIRETNKTKEIQCAFGISPAARWAPTIESCPAGSHRGAEGGMDGGCNNYYSYSDLFADTKKWVDEEWIDYLIPQAYAKLEDSYESIMCWWSDVMKDSLVKLYAGTALYNTDEWNDTVEILYQIRYNQSKGNRVDGYSLFTYRNIISGKGYNAMNAVNKGVWKTNALTPLYSGFEYKHSVSQLASIKEIIEVTNTELRLQYTEVSDAKAYILYKTKDKSPSDLNVNDRVLMNLKNKGYFDIKYDETYTYYLATVSEDNTIYINETPISFEHVIRNEAPVITQINELLNDVMVETTINLYFTIEDPEKQPITYEVYLIENGRETKLITKEVDNKILVIWNTPFVHMENLKFKIVATDGVKETIYETKTFNVIEECSHTYEEALCTTPKICIKCGDIIGQPLGHDFIEATCLSASECARCGLTEGTVSDHRVVIDQKVNPTCDKRGLTEGSHCSVCNEIIKAQEEIKPLGHSWKEATKQEPKTCTICGKTEGSKLKGCKKASIGSIILFINLIGTALVLLRRRGK